MARTAVIAGTATAASNSVNARHQRRAQAAAQGAAEQQNVAELQQQMSELQAQQVQSQLNPDSNDLVGQLAQLSQLQQSGVLSQEEFNAAKARLLGL